MFDLTKPILILLFAILLPICAFAQTPSSPSGEPGTVPTVTSLGDTGLWFVPSAAVLPAGHTSAGVFASSEPGRQGVADTSYGAASVARGIADRAEIFGAWRFLSEVDGKRGRGDLFAGAKIALASERRGAPLSLAVRSVVKIPTGDETAGLSTGSADVLSEIVASRRLARTEITGSTGVARRSDTDGVRPTRLRAGIGVAVRTHRAMYVFTEIHGERTGDQATGPRLAPSFDSPSAAAAGVAWTFTDNLTVGAGISRTIGGQDGARGVGVIARIGYRPGPRRILPPTPRTLPAPPTSAAQPPPPLPPGTANTNGTTAGGGFRPFAFQDVQFDLDRAVLRPDALIVLDAAASALLEDTSLRLRIEGHTCELGTDEYNLALGERRAVVVRNYLVSRGIAADRLQTVTFGEERPKHGRETEASRALNRRAEMHQLPIGTTR